MPCQHKGCPETTIVVSKKIEGGVLSIAYTCKNSHYGVWHSSSVLCDKHNKKVFLTPTLLASAVLLSGNNFEKLSLYAKCLNLNFVSQSSFTRVQSPYAVPAIKEMWDRMKVKVWDIFKDDVVLLCGDGRMNSPGFSAKYCLYTMMDHYLNVIVYLEVVDKREAGGTPTLMEKIGCKCILERVVGKLNLSEVVTDASSVIIKMVRELKGKTYLVWSCILLIFVAASAQSRNSNLLLALFVQDF